MDHAFPRFSKYQVQRTFKKISAQLKAMKTAIII